MGYDASQIQKVLDIAQSLNRNYHEVLKHLPDPFSIKDSVKYPIQIGTHHIADVVVYTQEGREPWIEFIK